MKLNCCAKKLKHESTSSNNVLDRTVPTNRQAIPEIKKRAKQKTMKRIIDILKKYFYFRNMNWRLIHIEARTFKSDTIVVPAEDFLELVWFPRDYWIVNHDAKGEFVYAEELGKQYKICWN